MDVLRAIVSRLSVDSHHVVEAIGIVFLGLVFYSYARRWLESERIAPRLRAPLRPGQRARFRPRSDRADDLADRGWSGHVRRCPGRADRARHADRGRRAGLVAALVASAYRAVARRLRRAGRRARAPGDGGRGALTGVGAPRRRCARAPCVRPGRRRVHDHVRARSLLVGARGFDLLRAGAGCPLLIVSVGGIGGFARLFIDVANAGVAEAARQEAASSRHHAPDRAAAHEINNALMVVAGGLAILGRRLPPDSEDSQSGRPRAGRDRHGQGDHHPHERNYADRGSSCAGAPAAHARYPPLERIRIALGGAARDDGEGRGQGSTDHAARVRYPAAAGLHPGSRLPPLASTGTGPFDPCPCPSPSRPSPRRRSDACRVGSVGPCTRLRPAAKSQSGPRTRKPSRSAAAAWRRSKVTNSSELGSCSAATRAAPM